MGNPISTSMITAICSIPPPTKSRSLRTGYDPDANSAITQSTGLHPRSALVCEVCAPHDATSTNPYTGFRFSPSG